MIKMSMQIKFLFLVIFGIFHQTSAKNNTKLMDIYRNYLSSLTINETLTNECISQIKYIENLNDTALQDYMQFIIHNSGKNHNDLTTFERCLAPSADITSEMAYLIVKVRLRENNNDTNNNLYKILRYDLIVGLCVPCQCSTNDYLALINRTNRLTNNFFDIKSTEKIIKNVLIVSKLDKDYAPKQNVRFFLELIPFYVSILFLCVSLFPIIGVVLFFYCFRKKKIDDNLSIELNDTPNIINSNKFKLIDPERKVDFFYFFMLKYKIEELTKIKTSTNNDQGLSLYFGIRSLCLLNFFTGLIFLYILNTPFKLFELENYKSLISNFFFGIITSSLQFSPKILLGISGFSLVYKMLSCIENNIDSSDYYIQEKTNTMNSYHGDGDSSFLEESGIDMNIRFPKISNKILFRFIFSNFYKYILYVFVTIYIYFTYYNVVSLINKPGPMWIYYNKQIQSKFLEDLLTSIFLIKALYDDGIMDYQILWILENEILLFTLFTIIIFLVIKFNIRLDIVLLSMIVLIFVLKIFFIIFLVDVKKSLVIVGSIKAFWMIKNPIINMQYYLIGMYFGLCKRYVDHKESDNNLESELHIFKTPKKLMNFFLLYNSKIPLFLIIFTGIYYIFVQMKFLIFADYLFTDKYYFQKEGFLDYYLLLDQDILFVLVFMSTFSLELLNQNPIKTFFGNPIWLFISRQYFSNALIIVFPITYILNQSESRMLFEILNIFLFSIIIIVVQIILGFLHYTLVEVPLRKMNRVLSDKIFHKSSDL